MNELPLLSVVVPLYNCENEVEKCLLSIINQSYKNIEIIVINDASTDNSRKTVENLATQDNRIALINLDENHGAGNARNEGINKAKGELIAFVDSDDWLDTNFYMSLYNNMIKYNSDIAVAGILNEYEYKSMSTPRYNYDYENCIDNMFALSLLSRSYSQDIYISPIVNNKMYRKSLFNENNLRYDKNSLYEDDILSFWIMYYAKRISITSNTNYHYLQRSSSLLHNFNLKHIDDLFDSYHLILQKIHNYNLSNIKEVAQKYFRKTMFAMLDRLSENVPNQHEQRKYIHYLLTKFNNATDILEVIDPIDFINMKNHRY